MKSSMVPSTASLRCSVNCFSSSRSRKAILYDHSCSLLKGMVIIIDEQGFISGADSHVHLAEGEIEEGEASEVGDQGKGGKFGADSEPCRA